MRVRHMATTLQRGVRALVPPAVSTLSRLAVQRFRRESGVRYSVGPFTLTLPSDHALPLFHQRWPTYDEPLRYIAATIAEQGDFRAVDIGANVGDSAALINCAGKIPVLCIEGDPAYRRFLLRNVRLIGDHVVAEHSFVGEAEGFVEPSAISRSAGTSSAVSALGQKATTGVPVRRLEVILAAHPEFEDARLVKIDTDGLDFQIIRGHRGYLAAHQPILFFEYLVGYAPSDFTESLRCIDALTDIGYTQFLVFDNFGHFMLSATQRNTFVDLNHFLLSNAQRGTAVHYLDVCAVAERDAEIAARLRDQMHGLATWRDDVGSSGSHAR